MEGKLKELKLELKKISNINRALAVLGWDMQTKMPKKGIMQRSEVVEQLSADAFRLGTSKKMGRLIDEAMKEFDSLSDTDKGIVKLAKKSYDETVKIPEERYREFVGATALSFDAWQEAKSKNDFEIFKPHLKKMIDFKREFAEYMGYEGSKYNALLGEFEEGLTVDVLDKTFGELRDGVLELFKKIEASDKVIDRSFLCGEFGKEPQKKFAEFVLAKMGYDFERGRLDESMHPFTTGFGNGDVRITTSYAHPDLTYCLFSCIHEGGHGIYEQDIPDELQQTGLDSGLAMSIHESQSRFYENLIGRSKEFWDYFLEYAKYEFPSLKNVSEEDFYNAINRVEPSLIRTEADELTYNLHIIIRYEIEKGLITGEIEIDDVKDAWNNKYKEYLGIEPDCDANGILQDMHWSDGAFGYFPSYALGNLYGAQMLVKMKEDYKGMEADIRAGNLKGVHNWLEENIHIHGATYNPGELIKLCTGKELSVKPFIDYLNDKYSKIYNLK
ncbi:carboxypeptidase M32 [uncultured Clostridium sp.]|jgi:carboxypeptidase Taq|uniref:carboxypeptidase M32 n=1 Tax=uncultured Clostridium sp. TaxID=59620 RepID=UPI0026339F38|nr:carboxypeptidase M32 [uncultured Clostridium sp.]